MLTFNSLKGAYIHTSYFNPTHLCSYLLFAYFFYFQLIKLQYASSSFIWHVATPTGLCNSLNNTIYFLFNSETPEISNSHRHLQLKPTSFNNLLLHILFILFFFVYLDSRM